MRRATHEHVCQMCGQGYSSKYKLKNHMIAIHGGACFICETCGKKFSYKSALKAHMKVHEAGRLNCKHCGAGYQTVQEVRAHEMQHRNTPLPQLQEKPRAKRQYRRLNQLVAKIGTKAEIKQPGHDGVYKPSTTGNHASTDPFHVEAYTDYAGKCVSIAKQSEDMEAVKHLKFDLGLEQDLSWLRNYEDFTSRRNIPANIQDELCVNQTDTKQQLNSKGLHLSTRPDCNQLNSKGLHLSTRPDCNHESSDPAHCIYGDAKFLSSQDLKTTYSTSLQTYKQPGHGSFLPHDQQFPPSAVSDQPSFGLEGIEHTKSTLARISPSSSLPSGLKADGFTLENVYKQTNDVYWLDYIIEDSCDSFTSCQSIGSTGSAYSHHTALHGFGDNMGASLAGRMDHPKMVLEQQPQNIGTKEVWPKFKLNLKSATTDPVNR